MSILAVQVTHRLDAAGSYTVRLPISDPRTAEVLPGRIWRHYREGEGFVFAGLIEKIRKIPDDMMEISGPTLLSELLYENTGLSWVLQASAPDDILDQLLGNAPWYRSGTLGAGVDSVRFDGQSLLAAMGKVVARQGLHYRENVTEVGGELDRQLEVGAFGAVTGVTLLSSPHETEVIRDTAIAEVTRLEVLDSSEEVWNWVIPVGSGDGGGQQTLRHSTLSTPRVIHTVLTLLATPQYFIADDIFMYDNFRRPDQAEVGMARSLHLWVHGVTPWEIVSNAVEFTGGAPAEQIVFANVFETDLK